MLRIISGTYRRLIINAPDTITTRPTTDKVREALMSSLRFDLNDAVCLDLFSGSGALGLESLSNGAKKCYFSDNNKLAYNCIKENIQKLHIKEETEVMFGNYKSTLEKLKTKGVVFDVVFLDPPYKMKEVYQEVVDFLFENNMLSSKACVVLESDVDLKEDNRFNSFKRYKYGIIHILVERR